jgi:hypothetical protein
MNRPSVMQQLELSRSGNESSNSTTSPSSNEETAAALEAMVQSLEMIAKSQKDVVSAVRQLQIELEQTQRSMTRSASSTSRDVSEKKLDDILEMVTTHGKAIALIGEIVNQTEAVKLPTGETVARGDLASFKLTKSINATLETTTAALAEVQTEVKRGHTVRLDEDKVVARLSRNLDQSMTRHAERLEASITAQESRLEGIGQAKATAVAQELSEAARRLERAEDRVHRLQRAITWQGVGRVALALVPFAVVALVMAGLLGLLGTAFGVGPLLAWAWASFAAASAWWAKALIAVGTVGGASLAVWLIVKLGGRIADAYRGW